MDQESEVQVGAEAEPSPGAAEVKPEAAAPEPAGEPEPGEIANRGAPEPPIAEAAETTGEQPAPPISVHAGPARDEFGAPLPEEKDPDAERLQQAAIEALQAFEAERGRPARKDGDEGGIDVVFSKSAGRNFHLDSLRRPRWHDLPPGHSFNNAGELVKEG